jgi:YD repeat-containing protein
MIDDRSTRYQLPLPHPANALSEDVGRLRSALSGLDGLLYTAQSNLGLALDHQTHWATSTSIGYDGDGRVSTITEQVGDLLYTTTLTYTNALITAVQTDGNNTRRTETLAYDVNDRLTGITVTETPL